MPRTSHRYTLISILVLISVYLSSVQAATEFKLGGFIKADMIVTDYLDGSVTADSALRDFYIPGAIPVGGNEGSRQVDFHAKETRFNLSTLSDLEDGNKLKTFLEFDFMLSDAGNERVSNSYQPRMRHAYFSYDNFLFGQTWSTFMIVTLPDNLDFIGAPEGVVFERQTQFRYSLGPWQFALENPETTVTPYQDDTRVITGSSTIPDLVARYNFGDDWGKLSVAAIYRQLSYNDPTAAIDSTTSAYGLTFGGKIKIGSQDDLRFAVTRGSGLGRYVGLNFVNGAVLDANNELEAIDTTNGFVGYLHHWNSRWRSSIDVAAFAADNNVNLVGPGVNKSASSISVNLLYSPDQKLTFGIELMRGDRELESGVDGAFNRIQFSAKYNFSFSAIAN